MNEQSTYISCFFFFLFLFSVAGLFLFLVFFFFSSSFLPARCLPLFFLSFLSFFSRQSVHLIVARLFLFCLFVCFFTSFNSSIFPCPSRWCRVVMLKTVVYGNQVRFESLKNSAGTCTKSDKCYIVIYTFIQHHNHTIIKTHEGRKTQEELRCRIKTQEDFFSNIFTSHFIARVSKGLFKVCMWEGAGDRT